MWLGACDQDLGEYNLGKCVHKVHDSSNKWLVVGITATAAAAAVANGTADAAMVEYFGFVA